TWSPVRVPWPQEGAVTQAWSQIRGREGSRLEGATQLEVARGGEHEDNVSRLRSSSLEIREKGSEILREQLDAAQQELKLKDKECERLSQVRDQLEQELEELTASLFEEAHKMVREANVKQAAAEKQLKEAQGKIDVLQAEVSALKTMVLTSTPSSPNRQAHPQLLSPGTRSKGASPRHGGGHTRNKSASWALPLAPGGNLDPPSVSLQPVREDKEMDNVLYAEFLTWKDRPSLDRTSAFLGRIYREDIGPCLSFTKSELSQSVQNAVENNSLTIEPVAVSTLPVVKANAVECGGPKKCALSGLSRSCKHRIKLGDRESYYYISPSSRARITAVCNFFTYIRYIQQGLVRHDAEQMFWEVTRLRREMTVAKLGFYLTDTDQG
uniref:RAB3A interacting protein like 1 n=1 Tax=Salmo trutta TaxID=8032 RepID=A0A673WQ57_SALTR